MPLALAHSQIVQAAPEFHSLIGKAGFVVAQRLFQHPNPLSARETVLHPHAGTRQVLVVALLARFQLAVARLFFG